MKLQRLMIAAASSGSGKTLLTCALLKAWKEQGKDVISCKCGPDYIDPMFHRTMLGIPSENLDTFFTGEETTRGLLARFGANHELAVLEGVMGLFDGLGGTGEQGSSYHLAKTTGTPIILVVDVHGMGRTMLSLVKGILADDREKLVKGILLNRISKSFYETMQPLFAEEIPVPLVGYFENHKDLKLESRHLGLKMPQEDWNIRKQLETAGSLLQQTVSLEMLLEIAKAAPELPTQGEGDSQSGPKTEEGEKPKRYRVAVARDEAFCFYYAANLRAFEEKGVEPVFFSPLHDAELPKNCQGIWLGGGYPENYAKELSENVSMKNSLRQAIGGGMPSLAECGGFLYLHRSLLVEEGEYEMVGCVDAVAKNQGKLVRFGYVEIREQTPWFLNGGTIKGHEFHYFDSTDNGIACIAEKPIGKRSWQCVHAKDNCWWGFPHLYFPSNPCFLEHFIDRMKAYQPEETGKNADEINC